jgi:hypothetical protein
MRSVYSALASVGRQFFRRTGIPVPSFVRQTHRRIRRHRSGQAAPGPRELAGGLPEVAPDPRDQARGLREEVRALARAVERLEAMAYIDKVGRHPEG